MFRELLTRLFPRNDRPARRAVRRRPLTLEPLEDRCVPTVLTVTTLIDETDANATLSLREAMAQAHANPSVDTIQFEADLSGSVHLAQGRLSIGYLFMDNVWGPLTIDGGGNVTLDAGNGSGVFEVQSGTVALKGLTFINGYSDLGGGLMVWDGSTVTLENSTVRNCTATNAGGGIFTAGILTLTNSEVAHNYSQDSGGGSYVYGKNGGSMTATDSIFSDNAARGYGGGIFVSGAVVTLTDSVLAHNATVRLDGGGIYNSSGIVTLTGTTVDANTAGRSGGGIYNASGGKLYVFASAFTNNRANSNKGHDLYKTADSTYQIDEFTLIDPKGIYEVLSKPKGGGR